MKNQVITTDDGSHTIFNPELNEIYHSKFGAIAESMHIYIHAGFIPAAHISHEIKLLEIGFGTGLNALLTLIENRYQKNQIDYVALEPFPLKPDVYIKLNYPEILPEKNCRHLFLTMHESAFEKQIEVEASFQLYKSREKVEEAVLHENNFHLVYFDAFSPDVHPELWSLEIFEKIFYAMQKNGILVTFSSRGLVKRNLIEAGFRIEKIPGPKGKREILRAIKPG